MNGKVKVTLFKVVNNFGKTSPQGLPKKFTLTKKKKELLVDTPLSTKFKKMDFI